MVPFKFKQNSQLVHQLQTHSKNKVEDLTKPLKTTTHLERACSHLRSESSTTAHIISAFNQL